jgi:flagellar protein FlbD
VIQLTRLNNKPLFVNADLIKFVEQSPDTLVTLISGEKLVVLETAEEIRARFVDFRRTILRGLSLSWDRPASPASVTETSGIAEPYSQSQTSEQCGSEQQSSEPKR